MWRPSRFDGRPLEAAGFYTSSIPTRRSERSANIEAYRQISERGGRVRKERGALDYVECVGGK